MAFTTIPSSGLTGNTHFGGSSSRWPGDLPCPDVRFDVASAEADPPRAYRYRPAANDPSVPDSDPRSPRFEPPHLRHRPGDTWIIDRDRPHDPLDPGPFGSPGWAPDNRTGRHRRAELPDPPREAEEANSSRPGPDSGAGPRRSTVPKSAGLRPGASSDTAEPRRSPAAEGAVTRRPSPRRGERDQPEAGSDGGGGLRPGRDGGDEPPPSPRTRFWGDADDRRRYDFGRLREDAWTSFLTDSAVLFEAHFSAPVTFRERLAAFILAVIRFFLPGRQGSLRSSAWSGVAPGASSADAGGARPEAARLVASWSGSPMAGRASQGPARTSQVSPFVLDWERHFDAAQAFREAVML